MKEHQTRGAIYTCSICSTHRLVYHFKTSKIGKKHWPTSFAQELKQSVSTAKEVSR